MEEAGEIRVSGEFRGPMLWVAKPSAMGPTESTGFAKTIKALEEAD
jgi:hypothetical protein